MPHPITTALIAAIAYSDEPMVLSDPHAPDHPLIAVNAAFATLTGYPIADTVGRNCRFLQGPGTDPATVKRLAATIADRQGCIEWVVNHRKDGTAFYNLLFMSPVHDGDGNLLHFFGNQRDMTDGLPADIPDHPIGRTVMPQAGQDAFRLLLRRLITEMHDGGDPAADAATLERIVAAARELNALTTRLDSAPWSSRL